MDTPTIAVLGSKGTCLRLLEQLMSRPAVVPRAVVTLDDREDPRSRWDEITKLCSTASVHLVSATTAASAYAAILQSEPQLVLVAGWYRIIPDDVLAAVPRGFFGTHYSLLPKYRGAAPVVWAMLNGDSTVGYSVFRLSTQMDEGPIALQGVVSARGRYVGEVLDDLDALSSKAIAEAVPGLVVGEHPLRDQPNDASTSYGGARRPADGRIDWRLPASDIQRFVRAQSRPYPGAFTEFREMTVRIWRAEEEVSSEYFGIPGQLVRIINGDPVIACGDASGLLLRDYEAVNTEGALTPLKLTLGSLRFS